MKTLLLALLCLGLTAPGAVAAEPDPHVEAKRLLSLFDHEPTVLEVQRVAARYGQVNPEAYSDWLSRAHLANLLPRRLYGRMQHRDRDRVDVRTTSSGAGSLSDLQQTEGQLWLELRAEWDLTRTVYNRDAIVASRQIERIVNQREDILTTVNKLYFARRQIQVEMRLSPAKTVQNAIRVQLRLDGLTADLDALTGGWFSREVDQREAARGPRR